MSLYKSQKVSKNLYRVPRPKRRMQINANESFNVVNHKGRWIVALASGHERTFKGNQTLNRTQAISLINFLSDYVNLVKPTQATTLHARIKASSNIITRASNELTGLAVGTENGQI